MATYLGQDWGSKGNWVGIYGHQGYHKAGSATANQLESSLPPYVSSVVLSGQSYYTWSNTTSDVRALQNATNSSRASGTFYSSGTWSFTANIIDNNFHKLSVYCMDWDSASRRQNMVIKNAATGVILDAQSLNLSYNGGVWLSWIIQGSVQFETARTSGANAVVQGYFFDHAPLVSDFGAGFDDGGLMDCYAC